MNTHHYKAAFVDGIRCTRVVFTKVNWHYTFCRQAFFNFLLACHFLTPFHIHNVWRKNAGRASKIASTESSTGMINLIFLICRQLSLRHFNFVTRLLLSLLSFLQLYAVFASCPLIEPASFLKSTNCILNNQLAILWWL